MSARIIVTLGIWILVMVLVGTMTVGFAAAFYVAMTAFFAGVVGIMMVVSRRRDGPQDTATGVLVRDCPVRDCPVRD